MKEERRRSFHKRVTIILIGCHINYPYKYDELTRRPHITMYNTTTTTTLTKMCSNI